MRRVGGRDAWRDVRKEEDNGLTDVRAFLDLFIPAAPGVVASRDGKLELWQVQFASSDPAS